MRWHKLIFYTCILISLSVLSVPSFAQSSLTQADTLRAYNDFLKAHALLNEAKYDSSVARGLNAARIYKEAGYPVKSARALTVAAGSLRKLENLDRAEKINLRALNLLHSNAPPKFKIDAWINLALIQTSRGNYQHALENMQNAKIIADKNSIDPVLQSKIIGDFGYIYDDLGDYKRALRYYKKALETLGDINTAPKDKLAKLYNNIGIAHSNMGNFDLARPYYNKEIELNKIRFGENHPNVAGGYINLGALAYRNGDIGLAITYFEKAYRSLQKSLGDHPFTAMAANNIGLSYLELENFEQATHYLEKALEVKIAIRGAGHPDVAVTYKNLGSAYSRMENTEKALEYYHNALRIEEESLGTEHPQVAETYLTIGLTLLQTGKIDSAIKNLKKSKALVRKFRGDDHPKLADIHQNLGKAYALKNNFPQAMAEFQAGLLTLLPKETERPHNININEITASDFEFPSYAVPLLFQRGRTLLKYYNDEHKQELLIQGLLNFELVSDVLDLVQQQYADEESKLLVGKKSHDIYSAAIETAYKLYQETENPYFISRAFYFAEKSKARIILESLQKDQKAPFSEIPPEHIEKEDQLREHITALENEIRLNTDQSAEQKDVLKDSLFHIKTTLSSYLDELEDSYPDYYRFKYNTSVPNFIQVKNKLRRNQLTLVEYFLADSAAFAIVITPENSSIQKIPTKQSLDGKIASFITKLQNGGNAYIDLAHNLYINLIQPVELFFEGTNLLIVPDGTLARLPFEALITDETQPENSFLMERYTIRYAGSVALSSALEPTKKRTYESVVLSFAPSFSNEAPNITNVSRSNWKPLATSTYEVHTIESLFNEKSRGFFNYFFGNTPAITYTGKQATEASFKEAPLSNFRIIHLATHAFISEKDRGIGGIVFSPSNNENEDGVLYSDEIYSLELNNEMVVLSACDTGRGEFVPGEGIMGLSRAFQFAGTSNLLASLWKVEDRSTSSLMVDFYRNITNDLSYARALQKAKQKLADDSQFSHPRYWAPFVLYGN